MSLLRRLVFFLLSFSFFLFFSVGDIFTGFKDIFLFETSSFDANHELVSALS